MKTEKKKYLMRTTMLLLLMVFTGISAWAEDVNLSEDTQETTGTAARWYVNLPQTGTNNLTLANANITTFKVYDDGGKGGNTTQDNVKGNYHNGCNGTLVITAPEGYVLQLSGKVNTYNVQHRLNVYNGNTSSGTMLLNGVYSASSDSWTDITTVTSTGRSMTLNFKDGSSITHRRAGLDLTVTLVSTSLVYNITTNNSSVNMPTAGTTVVNISDAVTSLKVYDNGGPNGNYMLCDGYLKLVAPEDYVIQLSGTVNIDRSLNINEATADPRFWIYDGDANASTLRKIWNKANAVDENIGTVNSSGNVMTLFLYNTRSNTSTDAGLDLTATLVHKAAVFDVHIADGIQHGTIVADPTNAEAGTVINLTATPETGYLLNTVSVKDANNAAVGVNHRWYNNGNAASFLMPTSDAVVTPTFTKIDNTSNEFSINIPKTGTDEGTIPEGVVSFKVYDDGGASGNYSKGCNGSITLTALTGYGFLIDGSLITHSDDGELTISNSNATLLNKVHGDGAYAYYALNGLISSDQTLTITFNSDPNWYTEAGLDLTVTMVNLTTSHAITLVQSAGGTVATDKTAAVPNEVVTLTVTPRSGYNVLTAPIVTDDNGRNINVTDVGNGQYTFSMPITDVTVTLLTAEQGWTFVGTYKTQNFTAKDSYYYGFVGTADKGKEVGTFVKVGGYVRVKPMRAYLVAPGGTPKSAPARRAGEDIPSTLRVRLLGSDGETTGIVEMEEGIRKKEEGNDAYYDLQGRKVAQPTKGLYIVNGKKLFVK